MKRIIRRGLKIIGTSLVVLFVAFAIWFMSGEGVQNPGKITWGVTFFPKQAEDLGVDWREAYIALLDDMGVKHLRLAAPWSVVESRMHVYDFSDIDWMIQEADKRGADVILAVGRKLFRWPECHDPVWAMGIEGDEFENEVLAFLEESINHFKQYKNIKTWQVENEPLFPFGECQEPKPNKELFVKEVELVRSLDSRPIMSTDSGELGSWLAFSAHVDQLGVSLYRVTDNPVFGRFYYPLRPGFYQKKARLASLLKKKLQKIFVSELQLEPWAIAPLPEITLREQFKSMSFSRMQSTVEYAKKTGFGDIYLWGSEWWYWLAKEQGDSRFWNLGKELMRE